ncbi:MAG TPA: DUF4142 domain-containing protein [Gemmatimonadaceae bacterium]|nr:DUF4142 domain-containing protein [Gemmatimonadaceae bacterium]
MTAYRNLRHTAPVIIGTFLLTGIAACGGGGSGSDANDGSGNAAMSADSAGGRNASATGATEAGANTMANTRLNDTTALQLIASVDRAEAASGQLAVTKARNSEVKAYARMMVQEHRADLTKIRRLVTAANMPASIASDTMTSGTGAPGTTGTSGSAGAAGAAGMTGAGAGNTNAAGAATGGSGRIRENTGSSANNAAGNTAGGSTAGANAGTQAGNASGAMGGTSSTSAVTSADPTIRQLEQMQSQAMTQLQTVSGAEFDKVYIESQLAAHTQVLDILRQNQSQLTNADVKAHVTAVQTAVEKHLQRAKEIQRKIGGDSTGTTATTQQQ